MSGREAEKRFVEEHINSSPADVALILSKKAELDKDYILRQINGRQKAKDKFPFLLDYSDYEFPSARAVAQSSSQKAAEFKAELLDDKHHKIADLSGGMGIDSYFLAKERRELSYLEPDPELYEISKSNFKTLAADHIKCQQRTAEEFLNSTEEKFDLIYLDPDRRKEGSRLIRLEDCEPNVIELQEKLFKMARSIMIKFSPLLDIKMAMEQLKCLKEVIVLSIKNECKELLFLMEKGWDNEPIIRAVDLEKQKRTDFAFSYREEMDAVVEFSNPLKYLYEPNTAIMKAGAFQFIAEKLGLRKLAVNTHLYTSVELKENFPGRILKIKDYDKSPKIAPNKINLVNRNSGMNVADLKKKFKIKDGGEDFLYACRLEDGKRVFVWGEKIGT